MPPESFRPDDFGIRPADEVWGGTPFTATPEFMLPLQLAIGRLSERNFMRGIMGAITLLGLLVGGTHDAKAQEMTGAASTYSNSGITAQSANTVAPTLASPAKRSSSPHLLEQTGPPVSEINRKDIEDNAGENAGKLMLRSVPSGAEIFINDLLVGRTPLLLVVAPGKYRVAMRGPRAESGQATIGVLPKETQSVVIKLTQRYPANVSTR
jgi:hypothetical protein